MCGLIVKTGRASYILQENDIILDNGAIYQIIIADNTKLPWSKRPSQISEKEFLRLKRNRAVRPAKWLESKYQKAGTHFNLIEYIYKPSEVKDENAL